MPPCVFSASPCVTNTARPETIDILAEAINMFKGGLLLVSHDMRLISQVAKEIWQCKDRVSLAARNIVVLFNAQLHNYL